jgi:hypothetical protein
VQVPERPPITEYPGYFPGKQPLRKRRWVQVTAAGIAAFVLGSSVGGGGDSTAVADPPTAEPGLTEQDVQEQVDAAVEDAVDGALQEAVAETKADERQRAALLVKKAEAQARARTRAAVQQAKADGRQLQAAAVARAVRNTQTRMRAQLTAPAPAPAPAAPAAPAGGGATNPQFSWCYEANDAGYGPYYQGRDPEYDWYDDQDGDGVVCET